MADVLITGVGSLPCVTPQSAVDHVFREYSLPFLPQAPLEDLGLPQMVREVLTQKQVELLAHRDAHGFARALAKIDGVEECVSRWQRLQLFAERIDRDIVKVQIVGFCTFVLALQRLLPALPRKILSDLSDRWLSQTAKAVVEVLSRRSRGIFLLFDEPVLAGFDEIDRQRCYSWITRLGLNAKSGVHCCDSLIIDQNFPLEVLSIDLSTTNILEEPNQSRLTTFLQKGGRLIFGIVDTRIKKINTDAVLTHCQTIKDFWYCDKQASPILLSGGCGTGSHTQEFEALLVESLRTGASFLKM